MMKSLTQFLAKILGVPSSYLVNTFIYVFKKKKKTIYLVVNIVFFYLSSHFRFLPIIQKSVQFNLIVYFCRTYFQRKIFMCFTYLLKKKKVHCNLFFFFWTMIYGNAGKQCEHVSKIIDPVDRRKISSSRASRK